MLKRCRPINLQARAMSSGDTKFRQLLVELKPAITANSTWVQVKRAVRVSPLNTV